MPPAAGARSPGAFRTFDDSQLPLRKFLAPETSCRAFLDPADQPAFDAALGALLQGRAVVQRLLVRCRATARAAAWVRLTCSAVCAAADSPVIVAWEDVTAQQEAERERIRLLHEAAAANRLKDEFLATVSHELRTPLGPILAWTQMLRAGDLAAEEVELEAIERNACMQAQLIDDLLDVSRIVSGKLRLAIAATDLGAVVAAAIESMTPAAVAKGVRLEAALDRSVGLLSADAGPLQQVVWNLLANAIKFTPEGGCVRVVSARREWLAVTVSDTGQGIEPGLLPHVFERFRQGTDPASRLPGGLGLGLAIVRHLVEAHGGTVHAESAGRGCVATFTVELPLPASNADPLVPAGTEGDPIVVR